ncbi:MAG TPA: hypothetical protein VFV87_14185, partial [Pirellulaceae bacterium]|nr:hypothetical protein [Pirellulaceae bacterium]
MAKRSRARVEDDLDDDYYEDEEFEERPARRKRREPGPRQGSFLGWFASRLLVVVVLLAVLVFFAPWIVSATGLWKPILAWAAPDVAGKVEIGTLRLGWISGIDLGDVTIRDAAGQPLAVAGRITSRKTLLEIVQNQEQLGTFDIQGPKINLVLREDGSNLEDFLASLPKSSDEPSAVGFAVTVTSGSIQLDDQISSRQWQLDNVNFDFAWPAAASEAKTGKLSAALKPAGEAAAPATAGEIAAEFS